MTITIAGIWIDRDLAKLRRSGLLDQLADLPALSEWCVMLGSSDSRDLDDEWTARDLGALAQAASDAGVRLVGTVWVRPRTDSVAQLGDVARMLASVGAHAIELEAEGNWQSDRLSGYASLDEAGRAVRDELEAAAPDLPVQSTIHLGRLNPSITAWTDFDTVQAYSKHAPDDGPRAAWGGDLGPAWRQVLAYQRLTEIHCSRDYPRIHDAMYSRGIDPSEVPQLLREAFADGHLRPASDFGGLGLPLWSQTLPGRRPHDALALAWSTAEALGCRSVRYWSAKWVAKNPYAEQWLAGLPLDRRAPVVTTPEPARVAYDAHVARCIAADRGCAPIAPWGLLRPAVQAAWRAMAGGDDAA